MTFGTEHEYSINDDRFLPQPVSDRILTEFNGILRNEADLGEVIVSKELQKHVLEVVPKRPSVSVIRLEEQLSTGMAKMMERISPRYRLLGLGMHPLLRLEMTGVWDHEEGEIYREYDRLFNIRQHGWLNIQALQINLSYRNEDDLVSMYNRIRALIPFLVALSAASPIVEGKRTGMMDSRLFYYRKNQERIPEICNGIIPERISSLREHRGIQEAIFSKLKAEGAAILCREWLDSRGVIVRFSRHCLEIKAMDEQECVRSDMAILSLLLPLLRCRELDLEEDRKELLGLLEHAIADGTDALRDELMGLYSKAMAHANREERHYLPFVLDRIEQGSLAEVIDRQMREGMELDEILSALVRSLRMNEPFTASSPVHL